MSRGSRSSAPTDGPPKWAGAPWVKADLFFLYDSLRHGMTFAEVAGFLHRTEDEVREQATKLGYLHRGRQ
jgi:hypothetical protein